MNDMGMRNGRWHPRWQYEDWNKWANTDEGKLELREKQEESRKIIEARKKRIIETAKQALKKPHFLTEIQRKEPDSCPHTNTSSQNNTDGNSKSQR